MITDNIKASDLSIRVDPSAQGQWCTGCGEVQAQNLPEIFMRVGSSYWYLCKLCAWDHAPGLVTMINRCHYSGWEDWGGEPPTPEALEERGVTIGHLLGEKSIELEPRAAANQHAELLSSFTAYCEDQELPDLISLVGFDPSIPENRRRETRNPICIPANLSIVKKHRAGCSILSNTKDISNSGAYVVSANPLPKGTHVRLAMPFPAKGLLVAAGMVVRTDPKGLGVLFGKTIWKEKVAGDHKGGAERRPTAEPPSFKQASGG